MGGVKGSHEHGAACKKLQVLEVSEENGFSWTVKADLPHRCWDAASAVLDGKLWLLGGRARRPGRSGITTATVFIYHIENNTWAPGPELPRAITECRAAVFDGELHVAGRNNENDEMGFCYRGKRWVQVPQVAGASSDPKGGAVESILLG